MKLQRLYDNQPSERQLAETVRDLKNGQIAIVPTDTVYAIVCDALNSKAIESICRLKGINPEKTNLSIICEDISMAADYAKIDNAAFNLMRNNTPGAFTFLLPTTHKLPKAFKGRKTVGVRIPDNTAVKALAQQLGNPLLTTSIQFEDDDYARNPELIAEAYHEKVDIIWIGNDGDTEYSTIVDLTGQEPEIIRDGKGILD
ncbi:MAG: L-threonylcarbamoyladenylate synthase [Muribaculum sp.]|nr:L-threonylcarbamoyladenylate synthase [Muribaculum sp.]